MYLVDELNDDELEDVAERMHLVDAGRQVGQGAFLVGVDEHHEGVALARHILLALQEGQDQLGPVRNQKVKVLVDGVDSQHGVAPHVLVPVFQTRPDRRH